MKKALVLLVVASMVPLSALAQQKAGDVYLRQKTVNAQLPTRPSRALDVGSPVYVTDTVKTGDDSLVKMILGGKATVTVREQSSLTITEEPGKSVVDMSNPPRSGGVAVYYSKNKPGASHEVETRTPNAIASVRGSLAVVDYDQGKNTTDIDNVDGTDVRGRLNTATSTFVQIPSGQGLTIIGNLMGPLRPIRPNVMARFLAKSKPGQGQKPDNPNVGADVSALGGAEGTNLPGAPGAGNPFGYNSRVLPGNTRGGYISKP